MAQVEKDEFRIIWIYAGDVVGVGPVVWQKVETAEMHAEDYLQVLKTDMGIQLPLLSYRIEARTYTVARNEWA